MVYHTKPITKGTLGNFSKIREEFEELEDAFDAAVEKSFNGHEWVDIVCDITLSKNITLKWTKSIYDDAMWSFYDKLNSSVPNDDHMRRCVSKPLETECSIIQLMKIAFHIGKIYAEFGKYSTELIDEFNDLHLAQFCTYISC